MALKMANNPKALIQGEVLASGGFVTVKSGKGGLFPLVYPYRCTMSKFVNQIVTQREIVEVTSRTGDVFTISRAVEKCPANDVDATSQTQTAFKFDDNDSFQLTRPASKDEELEASIDTKLSIDDYVKGKPVYGASSTGNDDYNITISEVDAYVDGATYRFKADVNNSGASTFEVNSLGAVDLKKAQGTEDLATNDVSAGGIVTATYNSTLNVFQFVGQEAILVSGFDVDTVQFTITASGSLVIPHSLGKVPKIIQFFGGVGPSSAIDISSGSYDGSNNFCQFNNATDGQGNDASNCINLKDFSSRFLTSAVTASSSSDFTLTSVVTGTPTGYITANLFG